MIYRGLRFRRIELTKKCQFFDCVKCEGRFMDSKFYKSKNLQYLCMDCVIKLLTKKIKEV